MQLFIHTQSQSKYKFKKRISDKACQKFGIKKTSDLDETPAIVLKNFTLELALNFFPHLRYLLGFRLRGLYLDKKPYAIYQHFLLLFRSFRF